MRLNLSAWAIRRPIPPLVLFLVLTALGLFSFRMLPITRMPNVDVPIVSVTITEAGAAPAELQTQVTKWVEDSVAGVRGVKHITSTITEGTSVTTVEFRQPGQRFFWPFLVLSGVMAGLAITGMHYVGNFGINNYRLTNPAGWVVGAAAIAIPAASFPHKRPSA